MGQVWQARLVVRALALGSVLAVALMPATVWAGEPPARVPVGPGTLRHMFPPSPKETEAHVAAFLLDRVPVTNGHFLAFVRAHPEWRRDRAVRLFVDAGYLSRWQGPLSLGPGAGPRQPVVHVSWFAARAYCAAHGGRLPTENEWELAGAASETLLDARQDPAFRQQLLSWYARPAPLQLPEVGRGTPNLWGVQDLHGLIWEWVLDYGSAFVSADNREGTGADKMLYCGAGALAAAGDRGEYAAFMRYAMRGSLQARDTTGSLGFRCAADVAVPAVPASAGAADMDAAMQKKRREGAR